MKKSVSSMRAYISREVRRSTISITAAVTLLILACVPIADALARTVIPSPTPVTTIPVTKSTTAEVSQTAQPFITLSPVVSAQAPTIATCRSAQMPSPTSLALDTADQALTAQNDTPTYYQIYGNTAKQLRNQILRCAPGSGNGNDAEFTAQTAYRLSWQYATLQLGNGSCKISDVRVGVHTLMALPTWQSTGTATSGLPGRWMNFMYALSSHEQGHVNLDIAYGQQLVGKLLSIGTQNCSTITVIVTDTINNQVGALNDANDNYDSATNHGASQGAILPTN